MPRLKAPPDHFSERVREATRGRTQDEVSRLTGIDRSDLSGYANGRKPDYVNLIKFCRALDISPTWLLLGVGHQSVSLILARSIKKQLVAVALDDISSKKLLTPETTDDKALTAYIDHLHHTALKSYIETLRQELSQEARRIFDREVDRGARRIEKNESKTDRGNLGDSHFRAEATAASGIAGYRKESTSKKYPKR